MTTLRVIAYLMLAWIVLILTIWSVRYATVPLVIGARVGWRRLRRPQRMVADAGR